jgi:glutathione S-transferase
MSFLFGGNQEQKVELGRFSARYRSQHLRLLMAYLGIQFTEREFEPGSWRSFKADLKTKVPATLPYIIDNAGTAKAEYVFDTDAIAQHLCQKKGRQDLLAKNTNDAILMKAARGCINDILEYLISNVLLNPNFQQETPKLLTDKIHPRLRQVSTFLGSKVFLMGDLSVLDFHLYEILCLVEAIHAKTKTFYRPQIALGSSIAQPAPVSSMQASQPVGAPPVGSTYGQPAAPAYGSTLGPAPVGSTYGTPAPTASTFGAPTSAPVVAQDPVVAGLDLYPNLKEYIRRFETIPQVQAFQAKNKAQSWNLAGSPGMQI